jgi:hypothetical protein
MRSELYSCLTRNQKKNRGHIEKDSVKHHQDINNHKPTSLPGPNLQFSVGVDMFYAPSASQRPDATKAVATACLCLTNDALTPRHLPIHFPFRLTTSQQMTPYYIILSTNPDRWCSGLNCSTPTALLVRVRDGPCPLPVDEYSYLYEYS